MLSGWLLLIGPPGSGKSAAAILLLDALRFREQAKPEHQDKIPVPVLFTLHGWNPGSGKSVTDWIVGKLAETYPMFRSRAGRRAATDLLAAGRVAGFLDGLDEIPKSVRPHVLTALADAPCRLVLLSRTAEAGRRGQPRSPGWRRRVGVATCETHRCRRLSPSTVGQPATSPMEDDQ